MYHKISFSNCMHYILVLNISLISSCSFLFVEAKSAWRLENSIAHHIRINITTSKQQDVENRMCRHFWNMKKLLHFLWTFLIEPFFQFSIERNRSLQEAMVLRRMTIPFHPVLKLMKLFRTSFENYSLKNQFQERAKEFCWRKMTWEFLKFF